MSLPGVGTLIYIRLPRFLCETNGRNAISWLAAVNSTVRYLRSKCGNHTFLQEYSGNNLQRQSEHLACFAGGNFLLGGDFLNRTELVDFGLQLVDACHEIYRRTASKIGPEAFTWSSASSGCKISSQGQEETKYILRPEVIESYYYAYRMTGDEKVRNINAPSLTGQLMNLSSTGIGHGMRLLRLIALLA